MGKKSKRDKPLKETKIKVKVGQEHIKEAHERLRLRFNQTFTANIEVVATDTNTGTSTGTEDAPKDNDELLERLSKILDFYRAEKIPKQEMLSDTISPVDLAYNTLCDAGIKRTINHGQQLQIPGEKLRLLIMRGYYGRDNVTENDNNNDNDNLDGTKKDSPDK